MNMKKLDNLIKKDLNKDVEIPKIVDKKINNAYDFIKNNRSQPQKKNNKTKLFIKVAASVAACFTLITVLQLNNSTFASKIPFMKNIFDMYSSDPSLDTKEIYVVGSVGNHAEHANLQALGEDINVTIQDVYCDGNSIFISYVFETNNDTFSKCDTFSVDKGLRIFIDNKEMDFINNPILLKKIDDNTFTSFQRLDLSDAGITVSDKFNLKINISSMSGIIFKSSEKGPDTSGNWNFDLTVTKDTSNNKIYFPNIESDGAKLTKVAITPGTTTITMDIPNEMGPSAYIMLYDDKGNKLQGLSGKLSPSKIGVLHHNIFESSSSTDIKYLTVKIVDKSKEELPLLAEFKVDLNK